jgi:hypothetical protein
MDSDQNDDRTILSPNEPRGEDIFNADHGQVVEVPNFEPVPEYETPVTHGQVVTPGEPPKKNNKTIWIIVAVVLAVICCCCIVAVVAVNNFSKDFNINDWQDMMDQFSRIIQLAPAFI